MSVPPTFPREIRVYARDADERPLLGSTISFFEDGKPRGKVVGSDGHATFAPVRAESEIVVTVDYEGHKETRTLTLKQDNITFVFREVRQGAATPPATPVPPPDPPPVSLWRNPTVVAASIAAIAALLGTYWQFIYKPGRAAPNEVTLAVFVKDASTGRPIPRADVTLQRTRRNEPRMADDLGTSRFRIVPAADRELSVTARASGYQDKTQSIDVPDRDANVEVSLAPSSVPPPVAASAATRGPTATTAPSPSGTWQLQGVGDPSLQRMGVGNFEFAPQSDGRILVRARFTLDGAAVELDGVANRQNTQLFLKFKVRSPTPAWSDGTGTLQGVGTNQLRGFITDAKDAHIALLLRKG